MTTRRGGAGAPESKTNERPGPHFGTIESAHEYVALLLRAVEESAREVAEEPSGSEKDRASRRREAFQIVAYKLEQLCFHLTVSRRRLNDLRTLRRLLHRERALEAGSRLDGGAADPGLQPERVLRRRGIARPDPAL